MKHILALDQGTTSSRARVFDAEGAVRAAAQREFRQTRQWQVERRFEPRLNTARREELLSGWRQALARTRGWVGSSA